MSGVALNIGSLSRYGGRIGSLSRQVAPVPLWLQLVREAEAAAQALGAALWYLPPAGYADRSQNGPFVGSDGLGGSSLLGSGPAGWVRDAGNAPHNLLNNNNNPAAWDIVATSTTTGVADPDGGTNAVRIQFGPGQRIRWASVPFVAGVTGSLAIWVRRADSGGAANIRLTTNNATAWNTGITERFALTSDWQRVTLTGAMQSGGSGASVHFGALNVDATSDATCAGTVEVYAPSLNYGRTAFPRIVTGASAVLAAHATQSISANRPIFLPASNSAAAFAGPDIVTNGAFESGTTGWAASGGASIAAVSGELVVTNTAGGGSEQAQQNILASVTPGRFYRLELLARRGTASSFQFGVEGNSVSYTFSAGQTNTTNQPFSAFFTPQAGQTECVIRLRANGIGTAIFDNVSIREIPTGAAAGFGVLSLDGANDGMRAGPTPVLDTADVWACVAVSPSAATTFMSFLGRPHAGSHIDPFWRWLIGTNGSGVLNVGRNGVFSATAGVSMAAPRVISYHPLSGSVQIDGSIVGASPAGQAPTYPTPQPITIGSNIASGESVPGPVGLACVSPVLPTAAQRQAIERLGAYIIGASYAG